VNMNVGRSEVMLATGWLWGCVRIRLEARNVGNDWTYKRESNPSVLCVHGLPNVDWVTE
jgi:hypothetical protein